jgi:O-antigen/teichoic acid export membrane protein
VIQVRAVRGAWQAIRVASPRLLAVTAGSLAGSMVLGAVLGAAFWWVAARLFSPQAVGVAVASLSLMSLVGSVAMVGAGTLLIRDLHQAGTRRNVLAGTAIIGAGALAAVVGIGVALVAPLLNTELADLSASAFSIAIFAAGVGVTTAAAVVDEILLALLRARLRLLRNGVFNVAKLAALAIAGVALGAAGSLGIYAAWVAGVVVSLVWLLPFVRTRLFDGPLFSWAALRELAPSAVAHQALNTAIDLPALGIPVAVALLMPPETTAQFYIAFMLASVAYYLPTALSQTLYAIGARAVDQLWQHARVTIGVSFAAGLSATVGLAVLAHPILSLFGPQYSAVSGIAPLLAVISLPLVVKDHFQIVFRIHRRERFALAALAVGAALEVGASVAGLLIGGLVGLAIGWLVAATLEASFMTPALILIARERRGGAA